MIRTALGIALLPAALAGQQFLATVIPQLPGVTRAAQAIDLDGDGVDEVVVRSADRQLVTFGNDGRGSFVQRAGLPIGSIAWFLDATAAVGDVDGDGDLDLVAQLPGGGYRPALLRNVQGALTVDPVQQPPLGSSQLRTAGLLDADGDGDLDLLVMLVGSMVLLVNDGTGAFAPGPALPAAPVPNALQLGDFDGDHAVDVALATAGGLRLWMRRQNGFVDESAARLPAGANNVATLTAVDRDGDGDLDLVPGNFQPVRGFALLDNDGSGRFADATNFLPGVPAAALNSIALDFDGDGARDLVLADQLVRNAGPGPMVLAGRVIGPVNGTPLQACDIDGDRFDDLSFGNGIARNLGGRGFRLLELCPAVVAGDLDGDGGPELIGGGAIWRNRGGVIERETTLTPEPNLQAMVFADLDGDGDVDLASHATAGIVLWGNDGSGRLNLVHTVPAAVSLRGLATIDYNRDGRPDLVYGGRGVIIGGVPPQLFHNFGGLNFGEVSGQAFPAGLSTTLESVAVGDADADGDDDLLFGDASSAMPMAVLLLARGNGTFAAAGAAFAPALGTGDGKFAQLDPDPELEIVVASNTALRVFDRQAGIWQDVSAVRLPAGIAPVVAFAPSDFDADGDVDLVVAGGPGFLLQNDGSGVFTDVTAARGPVTPVAQLAVDLDGDGDADLLDGFRAHLNQERQLVLRSALSGGRSTDLEFVARRGFGAGVATALVAAHVRALPVGVPLAGGRLFVEPNGAALLGVIASVNGQPGRASLPVPADPGLRGIELQFQGVVADAEGRLALLNHIRAAIE